MTLDELEAACDDAEERERHGADVPARVVLQVRRKSPPTNPERIRFLPGVWGYVVNSCRDGDGWYRFVVMAKTTEVRRWIDNEREAMGEARPSAAGGEGDA